MRGTIQVLDCPSRGVPAQAWITAEKSLSMRSSHAGEARKRRSVLRSE